MNFTDVLRFPCPSDTDYAAIPNYMQRLAEDIEAKILAQQALITDETNPPTAVWIGPSAVIGPFGTASVVTMSTFSPGYAIFSNFRIASGSPFGTNALPQITELKGATFPTAGIWHLGFGITSVATGAVTNDSNRLFRLQITKGTSSGGTAVELFGRHTNAESTIATDYMTGETVFTVDTEPEKYGIYTVFTHTNAGSTVQIPINGMYYWLTRIGSTDSIEVVA